MIHVDEAKYLKDYTIRLVFNDGKNQDVDFGAFLKKGRPRSICEKYLDLENFKNFKIENGNIVWGRNWDMIFPEKQLYDGKIL